MSMNHDAVHKAKLFEAAARATALGSVNDSLVEKVQKMEVYYT